MKKALFIAVSMVALVAFKPIEQTKWSVDKAHAKVGFMVTHMMVSDVEGWFKTFDGTVTTTKEDFTDAQVEFTADVKSINTEMEMRDNDLRSANYFDVEKYPTLTFKSKSFKKIKDNAYKVIGDLTMHGVTKSIVLDAVCRMGENPMNKKAIAGFKISGTLKRSDFGIGEKAPNAIVSDEIVLVANAELNKN